MEEHRTDWEQNSIKLINAREKKQAHIRQDSTGRFVFPGLLWNLEFINQMYS